MLYTYRCPVCRHRFSHDKREEPLCTGPSETRDDHEPTVMVLQTVDELHRYTPMASQILIAD